MGSATGTTRRASFSAEAHGANRLRCARHACASRCLEGGPSHEGSTTRVINSLRPSAAAGAGLFLSRGSSAIQRPISIGLLARVSEEGVLLDDPPVVTVAPAVDYDTSISTAWGDGGSSWSGPAPGLAPPAHPFDRRTRPPHSARCRPATVPCASRMRSAVNNDTAVSGKLAAPGRLRRRPAALRDSHRRRNAGTRGDRSVPAQREYSSLAFPRARHRE